MRKSCQSAGGRWNRKPLEYCKQMMLSWCLIKKKISNMLFQIISAYYLLVDRYKIGLDLSLRREM